MNNAVYTAGNLKINIARVLMIHMRMKFYDNIYTRNSGTCVNKCW